MVNIKFLDLKIDSIAKSSGVYSGMNRQLYYKHYAKQNQSFGTITGQGNKLIYAKSKLHDCDQIDIDFNTKINGS